MGVMSFFIKTKNYNFKREIVKYHFVEKLNIS